MVTIDNNEIRLNSRMEELSFSKTNYDAVVTQKGLLAKAIISKDEENHKLEFSFEDWTFSDIKSFETDESKKPLVFYCGKNPLSKKAKTLLEYEQSNDFFDAGYALVCLLTQAALNNIKVPLVGAGGILFDKTKNEVMILFLPEDLFKYSVAGLDDKQYSKLHAQWLNSTIYDLPGLCFMRSVIAYKLLTNNMPYNATDQLERNADFLDANFLPVNYCCYNIDKKLASSINKGLELNASLVFVPGKKKKGKSCEDLTPEKDFPLELLYSYAQNKNKEIPSEKKEAFELKKQAFIKNQQSKIKLKRTIRRNKTTIIIVLASIFIGICVITSTIKSHNLNYTSKGLTSVETIEGYFKSLNQKDSVTLDAFTKGGNTGGYNDAVGNIFVVGKMQQQYSGTKGFLSPARWLIEAAARSDFTKAYVYGVTNLKIDGKICEIDTDIAQFLDNPPAITFDNGKEVFDKDTVTHQVEYYHLFTEGEEGEVTVTHATGNIELTYFKDRWKITQFNITEEPISYNTNEFKKDFFDTLTKNNAELKQSINDLKEKYYWLCSDIDFDIANMEIEESNAFINEFGVK